MPRDYPRAVGRFVLPALVALGVLVSGCYNWRAEVVRTAGFEHGCPPERVRILGDDGNEMARSVRLNICGEERLYRDVGGARMYLWMDATATTSEGTRMPATSPGLPASVTARTGPWSDAAVLALLRQIHEPVLACTGGVSIELQVTITARGTTADVTGVAELEAGARACVLDVVANAAVSGEGTQRRVRLRIDPGAADAIASAGGEAVNPSIEIRGRLDAVSARVLACLGEEAIAVQAEWTAGETLVRTTLTRVYDAAAVACAEASIGEIRLADAPAESGRIVHAMAR